MLETLERAGASLTRARNPIPERAIPAAGAAAIAVEERPAVAAHYVAAILLSFSLLFFQVCVSRLLSVITWYHFSVLPITCSMLGLGVAGVAVHLVRRSLTPASIDSFCAILSLLYVASIPLCLLVLFSWPVAIGGSGISAAIGQMLAIFALILIPLMLGAMALTVVFHSQPRIFARLYCADLIGAAAGALAVFVLLERVSAPTALLIVASASALVPLCYCIQGRLWLMMLPVGGVLAAVAGAAWTNESSRFIYPHYSKQAAIPADAWQRWNSISNVRATMHEGLGNEHGLHPRYPRPTTRYLDVVIDGSAGTTNNIWKSRDEFEAFAAQFEHDAFYVAHRMTPRRGRAAIVGCGAGIDVMAAKHYGFEHVDAVDLNPAVIAAVRENAPLTYSLAYEAPGVQLHIDEGRNFIARAAQPYDLIQLVLVDTFAASASGSLALSENHLYSREGIGTFLAKLSDDGLLTITRWGFDAERLANVAYDALRDLGVSNPRDHMAIVACRKGHFTTANLILSRQPISAEQRAVLAREDDRFEVFFSPSGDAPHLPARHVDAPALSVTSRGGYGAVGEVRLDDEVRAVQSRGYTLVVLDDKRRAIRDVLTFDTCEDKSAAARMKTAVEVLPVGTVVAVAVVDDASSNLAAQGVEALQSLGIRANVMGGFNVAQAAIGVKGAFPGLAIEGPVQPGESTASVEHASGIGRTEPLLLVALLEKLVTPETRHAAIATHASDISSVDDNRPFFFLNSRGLSFESPLRDTGVVGLLTGANGNALLTWMNVFVLAAVVLIVLMPLMTRQERTTAAPAPMRLVCGCAYFACIGLSFMWIEILMLQRFILLLGHPVYSMTTILFSLLLGSGLGSLLAGTKLGQRASLLIVLLIIAAYAGVVGYALPPALERLIAAAVWLKVAFSVALVAPGGVLLGMAMPRGRAGFEQGGSQDFCWYWGVNGAASVLGAATGLLIATQFGYAAVGGAAAIGYTLAAVFYVLGVLRTKDCPTQVNAATLA